ncbi:MAG TPA: CSLREA domain-containing protein [Gaiellaceae bacterium]|nr:CSLREA domain-containing protein [Gaiellaceae bacterium]
MGGSSTVRGLSIYGFSVGIMLEQNGGDTVAGNWFGLDSSHNVVGDPEGVEVDGVSGNTIGGTSPADRNVFATQDGVDAFGMSSSVVEGNYFGYDSDGTTFTDSVGQAVTLQSGGGNNTIGGTAAGAGNVMATFQSAIVVSGSTGNTVEGNSIGVNADGSNVDGVDIGVELDGGATGNTVGGSTTAAGNVIGGAADTAFQVDDGGNTVEGNFVGTDRTGAPFDTPRPNSQGLRQLLGSSSPNVYSGNIVANTSSYGMEFDSGTATVSGNTIFGSGAVAIDLREASGVKITQNSLHDNGSTGILYEFLGGDTPPAPPTVSTAAIGATTAVAGTVPTPDGGGAYDVEIFRSSGSCSSATEGETYLGTIHVTGNGGTSTFSGTVSAAGAGSAITATATDPSSSTSEFSTCFDATVNQTGTLVVNTTADTEDGACTVALCSFRDAIEAANASPGLDTIDFDLPGGGQQTITLDASPSGPGPWPAITDPVVIDGTSEPGITPSKVGVTVVGGDRHVAAFCGIDLAAGSDGSTIRGLALVGFQAECRSAALLVDSTGNTIAGNFIGLQADGTVPDHSGPISQNAYGIDVTGNGNTIGGSTPADANVVVDAAAAGIFVDGSSDFPVFNTTIEGNIVGLLPDGATPAPNDGGGVEVAFGQNTKIGGPSAADGNVISANGTDGDILLGTFGDSDGSNTLVQNNVIGLTADRSAEPYGFSTSENAIQITDHGFNTIADNVIGGTYQGIDICNSPQNTVVRNIVGSNTASLGGPDFGVGNEGISMENGACQEVGFATGETIGGDAADGNTVVHSQLHNIAVDGSQSEVSYNTVRSTKGGPNIQVAGDDNRILSNTIASAHTSGSLVGNGVQVDSGTGNTISRNSIDLNDGLGIDLGSDGAVTPNDAGDGDTGPNGLQNFPVITSATMSGGQLTVDGSLDSAPSNLPYDIEIFQSPSCDPSGNGEGATFVGDFTIPAGQQTFHQVLAATGGGTSITATASAPDGSTSEFSACATAAASGGLLAGSVTQPTGDHQDLTAAGATDWALWGTGSSASLTPDVRKQGGSAISDLTPTHDTDGAPRNFGQFPFAVGDFGFDWSDGTPAASGSGVTAGLAPAAPGEGLTFTVPAGTAQQTLTVWTSAHYADEMVTATLSDGSAQPFSYTLQALPGMIFNGNENVPAVFQLTFAAASAGQHLTVTVSESQANGCCDDAVLYAAALAPASGTVTGGAATLSGGSVQMSGSNDPVDQIPLFAFEPTPPSTPPLQINGLQINGLQINGLPIDDLQINGLQINGLETHSTQINGLQINGLQINGLQINGLQINGLQINGLQINGLQINGLPIVNRTDYPDGWADLLGKSLEGKPLQTITLQDVLDQLKGTDEPKANGHSLFENIQSLTVGDLDFSGSPIGRETVGALALGSLQINGLPADLRDAIENQLDSWCLSVVPAGDPNGVCGPGGTLGTASLFQLGLAGAPIQGLQINGLQINGLQINGLQINGLQINGLAASASAIADMQINGLQINGLQINGLQINGLQINGLPANVQNEVFDCTKIDCATATIGQATTAGAIRDGATLGQLDVGSFLDGITIGSLLQNVLGNDSIYKNTVTFGDLVGLLIKRDDVPWETLTPHQLAAFDPSRPTLGLTAAFTLQGSGTLPATVKVKLPAGFDFDFGTAATLTPDGGTPAAIADPVEASDANGTTLTFTLPAIDAGTPYTLDFRVRSGTDVGQQQASVSVSAGGFTTPDGTSALTVTDAYPSLSPAASPELTPGAGVQMSALPDQGDVDYYKVPMPAAGTRVLVHLTNLPADYDLALYSATSTSVRTTSSTGPPLQDGTVPDTSINLQGGPNAQLQPDPIQDVPNPGGGMSLQLVGDNRGTDDEDVAFVSPGGGGDVLIAVYGYHGASGPSPYSLRVTEQAPPASPNCAPVAFPHAGDGVPGTLPSIPTNLNTLILVNEKRLGDQSGSADASAAIQKLQDLAADTALGVRGLVLPVESIPGVQAAYDTWDANPCNVADANAIANLIADEIALVKASNPGLRYVVFAGGDDQIPFFRTPDLTRIANESGFASSFAPNQYQAALAAGDLLTDNPYLDTQPTPSSGGDLFVPNLIGGRLVETAGDITGAVTSFESANGTLHTASGFVSGYDFVSDGSQQVADRLTNLGVSVSTLPTPLSPTANWSKSGLLAASFPNASITDWNGHFDNTRALMANGTDLLSTSDFGTTAPNFDGGVFFTMGCHAGFQTSDVVVGGAVLDWAQYFAGRGTQFVGNTGFGLGSTDGILYSEELMSDFAGSLTPGTTIGAALTQAKDDYFLSRTAYSSYDDKTLSEAELYGLPMYSIGTAPASLQAARLQAPRTQAPLSLPSPDPVHGADSSSSPSRTTLAPFPGTDVQAAPFAVTPHFDIPVNHGANGDYYTNGGQAQAPNYAPLQPYVNLPATRSEGTAHGVVIDSLTSDDHLGFNPDNLRPIVDQSANEPEPQFLDEASPAKIPTLVSLDTPDGLSQSLNLTTGQFFTQSSGDPDTNVERLWTQIGGRVTYSSSSDFTPPTIDQIASFLTGDGAVAFTGKFSDVDQNGNPGHVVFAQIVFDADNAGHWATVQLAHDAATDTWSGGAPFTGDHVQFFVEACDDAGNCGFSSNKGRYFDAQPLPAPTQNGGTLTLAPQGQKSGSFYTGPVTVDATSSDPAVTVTVSVDGGPDQAPADVDIATDGAHTITAHGSDGSTASTVVLVDRSNPTIDLHAPDFTRTGGDGTVQFSCADGGSGVASCTATDNGSPILSGHSVDTSSAGSHAIVVTAIDNVGHQSTASTTIQVLDGPTKPGTPSASPSPNAGTFTVSWGASTETSQTITYLVERAPLPAGAPWTTVASGISATSTPITGLAQGVYEFRVTASDGHFTSTSDTSAQVVVDTTNPTVGIGPCPTTVHLNASGLTVPFTASDSGGSGLVGPGSGSVALDTSSVGLHSATKTVADNAGNTASSSCDYTVIGPPSAPGKPSISSGPQSPNQGAFTLTWGVSTSAPLGDTLTYTLEHKDAAHSAYSVVASGLTSPSYTFTSGSPETQGTWTYKVFATDLDLPGSDSVASDPVKVDRTKPAPPLLQATTSPVAGSGGWFLDTVTVDTVAQGDPTLPDSSPGSGIDAALTTGPQTKSASGTYALSGTVTDNAGNQSDPGTGTFKVDATAPTITISNCPAAALALGASYTLNWTVADNESGPVSPTGSLSLATNHAGTFTANATGADKVGHSVTKPCQYQVRRGTPVITWSNPAPILFGTPLGATQLNATANVPGTFAYNPPAGSVLQPGTQSLSVTFTPTNTADYDSAAKTVQIVVGFSQPCLTTTRSTSVTVASGQAFCIGQGGSLKAGITVQPGGALYINGGSVNGSINATSAKAIQVCAVTMTGSINSAGATGRVVVGGPLCSGTNSVNGSVSITNGTGGVTFVGNSINGSLTITGNTGGLAYSGNTVTGKVTVKNNS